jgi:hypothetical protein
MERPEGYDTQIYSDDSYAIDADMEGVKLVFRLGVVLTVFLSLIGCQTNGSSRFSSLLSEPTLSVQDEGRKYESSANGYRYTYTRSDADQATAITYHRIFSVAAIEAYSSGVHPFSKMKPAEFVQSVEQHALELGTQPALALAEFVDQATNEAAQDPIIDEHLYWLVRDKILYHTSVSDKPGFLYQKRGNTHLIITERISINSEVCRIRGYIVDDESKPLLSAQLRLPDGTTIDDSLLRDATQLMWDTLDQ